MQRGDLDVLFKRKLSAHAAGIDVVEASSRKNSGTEPPPCPRTSTCSKVEEM